MEMYWTLGLATVVIPVLLGLLWYVALNFRSVEIEVKAFVLTLRIRAHRD